MEPLLTILAFSVNSPLPDLPNFYPSGLPSLGTRYGEKIRIILERKTGPFERIKYGTSINIFS